MIRVIVADDEEKVCQLICQLIDWDALEMELVGTASNGIEVLRLIQEKKPDLILSDIRMPGCNGLELMKQARESDPDLEFIIISGYSSFEYAQTAIQYGVQDYILKPVNRQLLNATLQKVRKRYLEKHPDNSDSDGAQADLLKMIWFDLENGGIPAALPKVNEKYYAHFQPGIFQVFCIQESFKDFQTIGIPYAQSVFDLLFPLAESSTEELIRPLCYECNMIARGRQIFGLLNYAPQNREQLQMALTRVVKGLCMEIHAFERIELFLSVSGGSASIAQLGECREQAQRAMEQRLLLAKPPVFLCEAPESDGADNESLYHAFSTAAQESIALQSEDQLRSAVRHLEESVLKSGMSGHRILHIVKAAYHLFLLSGLFQSESHFLPTGERETCFNDQSDLCGRVEHLFRLLEVSCLRDLREAGKWSKREKVRPVNEAKRYISEHYAEPLNLDGICSHVGLSPNYFSTLFRKETGKTFLEYLLEIRINAAKKLLRETKQTMEAVCESVGIHDYKRFSKAFKKATGVSPKEYRNLYS
ncbi:putative two-component system response regulator [Oscillibacter valericigenes Sjm18-20]|nr:putative two-component system response regulator [Oscillibacter valericigenes Sjm18-20]